MSGYILIETKVYSNVTEIHLYDETTAHVVEEHEEIPAELPSIQSAVVQAIVRPTRIEKSYGNSYVFVDETSTNWSGDPLRVPVKMVGNTSGRVKSFYFATSNASREVVWRLGDE